jgi:hypothetical protein
MKINILLNWKRRKSETNQKRNQGRPENDTSVLPVQNILDFVGDPLSTSTLQQATPRTSRNIQGSTAKFVGNLARPRSKPDATKSRTIL